MNNIKLLATDIDGTLIGPRDEYHLYASFRTKLWELRERCNTVWVVLTGRSNRSFLGIFKPMAAESIFPDFVITMHAFIYSVTRRRHLRPRWIWNMRIFMQILSHTFSSRRLIRQCIKQVLSRFRRVRITHRKNNRVRFRFRDSDAAEQAARVVRTLTGLNKNLLVSEYLMELEIRTIPFAKGVAMLELARQLAIPRDNILAIGDGLNDMSMLDGRAAALTACPSNAVPEIMEAVHKTRGHIAATPGLSGTLEALDAYINGSVCSDFPKDWLYITSKQHHEKDRVHRHLQRRHALRKAAREISVFTAAVLIVILVLARFELLGPLSRIITAPFDMIIRLLARLTAALAIMS